MTTQSRDEQKRTAAHQLHEAAKLMQAYGVVVDDVEVSAVIKSMLGTADAIVESING